MTRRRYEKITPSNKTQQDRARCITPQCARLLPNTPKQDRARCGKMQQDEKKHCAKLLPSSLIRAQARCGNAEKCLQEISCFECFKPNTCLSLSPSSKMWTCTPSIYYGEWTHSPSIDGDGLEAWSFSELFKNKKLKTHEEIWARNQATTAWNAI